MSKLIYVKDTFYFKCGFTDRNLAKEAGFTWNPVKKIWYTMNETIAAKLVRFADDQAKSKIKPLVVSDRPLALPLSTPKGLELMPHQLEAISFAMTRNRSYLGLDPGLGKTIVAATITAQLGEPVVYICPPFLVQNTKNEFEKWAPERRVHTYDKNILDLTADVYIVPDSMIGQEHTTNTIQSFVGRNMRFDPSRGATLFGDEAHRFKNPDAQRTKAFFTIANNFERVILMSGTPMPNRPIELFPVLSKLAPETIGYMSHFQYGKRYCAGFHDGFGWDFSGASNMQELARRVVHPSGPFMLRQKKALLKLPPKLNEVFVISDRMSPRIAGMDSKLGEQYSNVEDLIKMRIAEREKTNVDDLHVATYRRHLGAAKVEAAVTYIHSLMQETEEHILVFAYHTEVVAELEKQLYKFSPLVVTGQTKPSERQAIVDRFQSDGGPRIIIGNYVAMGVGFTLTKATRVLFVEFSWVPGENEQASDRAHRIGQTNPVLVQYMVYKDSLDKAVIESLLRKQNAIQHV